MRGNISDSKNNNNRYVLSDEETKILCGLLRAVWPINKIAIFLSYITIHNIYLNILKSVNHCITVKRNPFQNNFIDTSSRPVILTLRSFLSVARLVVEEKNKINKINELK